MANYPHDKDRPESAAVKLAVEIYREEGDVEPLRKALSPRQRAFCEEYVVDFNASAAVIRAGYSKNWPDRQGHQLMRNAGVCAYIDSLTGSKESKLVSVDPDYVIAQVTAIIHKDGAKDGDKLRALELLARHLGMLTDRSEQKVTIDVEQKQRIEEDSLAFITSLKQMRSKTDATLLD